MTKSIKNPYVKFIGSNSTEVTGSCSLVRFQDKTILVDYGLRQTSDDEEDYKINSKRHKDIKPKQLDAIIITHIHQDHQGLIPSLFKDGANCPIYMPKDCKKLATLMWQDCTHIYQKDFEKYNRKPIYTQSDVDMALSHVIECDLNIPISICNSISFTYYNAQHIVRACQVYMELNDGVNVKKIGFTGDISNSTNTYYLDYIQPLPQVDILVGECTYSNNTRLNKSRDRLKDREKIDMAIKQALDTKGKVLIPVFSLDRLQTILTTLYDMYEGKSPIKILIDTPLGKSICSVWEYMIDNNKDLWHNVYNWNDCLWTSDFKDTVHWSKINEPMLVIGGGGMLSGGRATYWIKELLGSKKNRIVFCGYSTPESTAGKIKSGKLQEIKIDGKKIPNKAPITILNSFSSHMDYEQLLSYYTQLNYTKICLVHSEQDSKIAFANELKKRLSKSDKTSKVIATNFETKVSI